MNFRYFVYYVDDDFDVFTLYADDDRMTALRIFRKAKNRLCEYESVYLVVRTTSAMRKGKQEIALHYYHPKVKTHGLVWREVKKM